MASKVFIYLKIPAKNKHQMPQSVLCTLLEVNQSIKESWHFWIQFVRLNSLHKTAIVYVCDTAGLIYALDDVGIRCESKSWDVSDITVCVWNIPCLVSSSIFYSSLSFFFYSLVTLVWESRALSRVFHSLLSDTSLKDCAGQFQQPS